MVGAETLSRIIDPDDRATCIVFGDAAAALVLEAAPDDGPGLLSFDLGCSRSILAATAVWRASWRSAPVGAGGRRPRRPSPKVSNTLKMQGPEVFRRAVRVVVESANTALTRADVASSQIDWFIPRQANARIIDAAASRLRIPSERTIVNIDRYGNTSAASIPLVLSVAADAGQFEDGQLLLVSGFGAGMTWGSAVLRWRRA